ncbi:hypothetical protein FOZ60_014546 [Perkinsus olseni]|uniref:Uncharacterized protein n=2 Tax=Perkinsus olseni TaxID=32597 RepID=A0A7J6N7Q2_PEROL|nr:hypothetical protein FOZ60_014546 [Perkinsus olseni]
MPVRRPTRLVPWYDGLDATGQVSAPDDEKVEAALSVKLPVVEKDIWEDTDSDDSGTETDEAIQRPEDDDEHYEEVVFMETVDADDSSSKLEVFLTEGGVAVFETVDDEEEEDDTSSDRSGMDEDPMTPTNMTESNGDKKGVSETGANQDFILQDDVEVPRPKDVLFVWDYDDTILPTEWCTHNGASPYRPTVIHDWLLDDLDRTAEIVHQTLEMCRALDGEICIITNAESGWIGFSSLALVPSMADYLLDFEIISARSVYAPTFPDGGNGARWKMRAFHDKITAWLKRRREWEEITGEELGAPSVYSFGDCNAEREAMRQVCSEYNIIGKSVKFLEKPRSDQIRKEHRIIQGSLKRLMQEKRDLDLFMRVAEAS